MKRTVAWADSARADIRDQIAHIAADDPHTAGRVAEAIRTTGAALGEFATGHPGRVARTYEKSVLRLPYVMVYALSEDDRTVVILRVIHAARDCPPESWPQSG